MRHLWIVALLALSGCVTDQQTVVPMSAEDRAASAAAREKWQKDQAAQAARENAAREAQDDSKCRSYGAKPGSKPYIDCRLSLNQLRDQQGARAQAAAAAERAAEEQRQEREQEQKRALAMQYLISRQQQPAPTPYYVPVPAPNASVNCTSNRVGNQTYTNCN